MIFDDICVFELDFTLLLFREILNIFRCFSKYWKILKVSKSRNLCVRRRADLQKVHSQPGLEVGYVSRVSMRKKSFGIDCLQKSYSIIIVITTMIIYCVCFFCAFCDNRHSRRSEGWPHTLVRFTYVYLYIYMYIIYGSMVHRCLVSARWQVCWWTWTPKVQTQLGSRCSMLQLRACSFLLTSCVCESWHHIHI